MEGQPVKAGKKSGVVNYWRPDNWASVGRNKHNRHSQNCDFFRESRSGLQLFSQPDYPCRWISISS